MKHAIHIRSHTAPTPGYNPYPETRYWIAEVRNEDGEAVYATPGYESKATAIEEAQDYLSDLRSRQ